MSRETQEIGPYRLIRKLGRGGFGEVWLAEKRSQFITKKVAIKLPHGEQVNSNAIKQEATLWEQASGHPNVLPIIDADIYDGQVVIVSEYADGGSLADKLKLDGKLPVENAVKITSGILSGLEYLHTKNIIHRDIKPQNILLQGNTPRLADFGISRAMNTSTISSIIVGTDAYMAPEAFDGKRNVQTDIWSVGVVLYQLLKGELPFPQEHHSERIFAILTKEFEPLPYGIPQDLSEIVKRALSKNPVERFRTADEMRQKLDKALMNLHNPTFATTEVFNKQPSVIFETQTKPRLPAINQISQINPAVKQPLLKWVLLPVFIIGTLLIFFLFAVFRSQDDNQQNTNVDLAQRKSDRANQSVSSRSNTDLGNDPLTSNSTNTTINSTNTTSNSTNITSDSTTLFDEKDVPQNIQTDVGISDNPNPITSDRATINLEAKISNRSGNILPVRAEKFYLLDENLESILRTANIEDKTG